METKKLVGGGTQMSTSKPPAPKTTATQKLSKLRGGAKPKKWSR